MAKDFNFDGKYTFLDVEIPNINNDCICAISIIVIEDGYEVLRTTELIDPKTFFSTYNVNIHGITQKQVRHARTLEEFWADYSQYFGKDYIIGAHNTLSDISVLRKDLKRINKNIEAESYVDTMDIMSTFYYKGQQHAGDLKLNNIAKKLEIELDHHNPESDVNACYEVIRVLERDAGLDIKPFIKPIPDKIGKSENGKNGLNAAALKKYLNTIRREISLHDPRTEIDRTTAEHRGHKAFKNKAWKDAILYYEVAVNKKTRNPAIYRRLAQIYDDFEMYKDAIRILERGIRELKRFNINFQPLNRMLSKERSKLNQAKNPKT